MKKLFAIVLCFSVMLSVNVCGAGAYNTEPFTADTAEYIYNTISAPGMGSVGGEWAVTGLARSGYEVPDSYYAGYLKNISDEIRQNNGVLSNHKYTEQSRVIVALTSLGQDASDFMGYNLFLPLSDTEKVIRQGINGAIWALIAMDCGGYNPAGGADIRKVYTEYILERQNTDGGWALSDSADYSEPDITAMALCALSEYAECDDAVKKGLEALSHMQAESGGFKCLGVENAESCAQVIIALSECGVSLSDEAFVKNGRGVLDALMEFYAPGEGFMHTKGAGTALMASEQALCALVAADRALKNRNTLFDMSDSEFMAMQEEQTNEKVKIPDICCDEESFTDISGHSCEEAVYALAHRGIVKGRGNGEFAPDGNMTRAELATVTVNALGLLSDGRPVFDDVKEDDWFYDYATSAYDNGIIKGVSEGRFNPEGTLTVQEAAVMITRASELCGLDADIRLIEARDILSGFTDYVTADSWAHIPLAFCFDKGILSDSVIEIQPHRAITRAELVQMLYNMLCVAELIQVV